jgi:hypothetical protein
MKNVVKLLCTHPGPPGLADAEPDIPKFDGPGHIYSSSDVTPFQPVHLLVRLASNQHGF